MSKISREDIIEVANSINVTLNENQIEIVLANFQDVPNANWALVVENTIYSHVIN